jgi:hypothetical protein
MRWKSKTPEADGVRWERTRARGKWWYLAQYTFAFGLGLSGVQLIGYVVANVIDFTASLILINFGIGFLFGFAGWSVNESRYRESISE